MTTYDQYAYDDSVAQQAPTYTPEQEEVLPGKALNASQKKAIAAALVGTAALGGAAYGLSRLEDNDNAGQLADTGGNGATDSGSDGSGANNTHVASAMPASFVDTSHDVAVINDEPRMATTVDDGMTFEEAFSVARGEMGPGDYFTWHGNYYNTFYKEEWEGMNDTQHQAFVASLGDLIHPNDHAPTLAATETDLPVVHHHTHTPAHHTAAHQAASHVANHQAPVHVVPAVVNETAHTGNVSVIDEIAGANSNVTVMHVDGHNVSLIDTNNDKKTDMTLADNNVVLVDTDRDHKLDSHGSYNATTHQVDHLHPLETPIGAPNMDADDRQDPADYEQLYSDHDLTISHDHLAHGGHSEVINLGN